MANFVSNEEMGNVHSTGCLHAHLHGGLAGVGQDLIHSPLGKISLQQVEVGLPLVSDHLAAGEAPHRDDHIRLLIEIESRPPCPLFRPGL